MNSNLHTVYAYLVSRPDRAELIEAADELILAFARNPKLFVMPKIYKWATPLLEAFAFDPSGWMSFVRAIADEFPKRSEERRPVQLVYRKLNVRHDAAIRRQRLRNAMVRYEEHHGGFTSRQEAEDYQRWLFQYWAALRRVRLAQVSAGGKTSAEERREVCDTFWEEMTQAIPPGLDEIRKLRDDAVALDKLVSGKKK